MAFAAVVLAAGRSRRFAPRHKLLTRLDGTPLWWAALSACCESKARPIVVVLGARHQALSQSLWRFRARRRRPVRMRVVTNHRSARGMAGSLQKGLAKVPTHCAGAIVVLADMPGVRATALNALITSYRPGDDAVVPTSKGRRGNPVLLPRTLFESVNRLRGDQGARRLLKSSLAVREVSVSSRNNVISDIDTPRDYVRYQKHRRVGICR